MLEFFAKVVTTARESARLWQVFQQNSYLSGIARKNFEMALQNRGLVMSDGVLKRARAASAGNRKLTVGQFLDESYKQKKSQTNEA